MRHHQTGESLIIFNDPLLFQMIGKLTGAELAAAMPNPFYMAAWIGLLVTSLNLMPVGQLDGGHGTFSVFGPRLHGYLGECAFIVMATDGGHGICVVRQSQRVSLHGAVGGDVEGAPSSAAGVGTVRD